MEKIEITRDLADAIFYQICNLYEKNYSHDDNPSALSYFTSGKCWYMAKMLKYLLNNVTIIEKGSCEHFFIEGIDKEGNKFYINPYGYENDPKLRVVTSEYYAYTDDMVAQDLRYDRAKLIDAMCLDIVNTILSDEYYNKRLGPIRGEVPFYGMDDKKISGNLPRKSA